MRFYFTLLFSLFVLFCSNAQNKSESGLLTIDQIFASGELIPEYQPPINWIANGESYIIVEYNQQGQNELIKYNSSSQERSIFLSKSQLTPIGSGIPLFIEEFSMSDDESKVLIFTNSKRVWRTNTKGDYWVYDLNTNKLSQIGKEFPSSSLMFAKFSNDNQFVAYVMDFNLYKEDFKTGKVTQLTKDGTIDIINGTFDWVYEEEFACQDGFRWSPDASKIAYWQLDASSIGRFNMINYTDSVYSRIIPLQYPKVGQDPSSAKIGIVDTNTGSTDWVKLEGSTIQNYIPGIQWISKDQLLVQQINRKQNHLKIWIYNASSKETKMIYEEKTDEWIDVRYPGITSPRSKGNTLKLTEDGASFLRLSENKWRDVYKINLLGKKTLVSTGTYDVASIAGATNKTLYYHASPENSTRRYLYSVTLDGKKKDKRITPSAFEGVNKYNISPNGKYALHTHSSSSKPTSVHLISLPNHKVIKTLISNEAYQKKVATLKMSSIEFVSVNVDKGVEVDARMMKPYNFDPMKKYPVIFNVYGEPWGQLATDSWIDLWNVMMTQKGYIVIAMDPRGTPCLKGTEWRKSIYRNIGNLNIKDLGKAAMEIAKFPFVDEDRIGVWGWSGGGSSTLNLLFQYPKIFKTGVSVAPVANQLTYDNIYQERYMGLPQENREDFVAGSPVTHAKNLEGNLLLIHGTGDDNVHYQNAEMLINELILHNKQFDMMSYPNRSHGIYEGQNTRRHLYTLITNYFMENLPVD